MALPALNPSNLLTNFLGLTVLDLERVFMPSIRKRWLAWIHEAERKKILALFVALQKNQAAPLKALDAGCGYGANLKPLLEMGIEALGVEINPVIRENNIKRNLPCIDPQELEGKIPKKSIDVILTAHVIEHLAPKDCLNFLNFYLDYLKPGGYLIIATPLLSPYFFDDFDHVKPYQPTGLSMLFSGKNPQVQYYANHSLELVELYFRRTPLSLHFQRVRHLQTGFLRKALLNLTDISFELIYLVSGGYISRTDGWIGLYQEYKKNAPD